MKKIVLVEDRPWFATDVTVDLQRQGIEFYRTIYYPSSSLYSKDQDLLLQKYKEKTGVKVEEVHDQREFINKMDELYGKSDLVFLMDYDLKGDMGIDDFFQRINIKYALEKRKEQAEEKIWFYTTGGLEVRAALLENFEGRVIRIPLFKDGQLQWDEAEIKRILEE